MNPPPPSPGPNPSNARYEMIARAALIVKSELSLVFTDGQYLSNTDYDSDLENNINMITPEDLEHEIFILRSFLEYFYSRKTFPFSDSNSVCDFVSSCTPMSLSEFNNRNQILMNRYKTRLWKICKKFQILETDREQHAFELGNRLWGSMSYEMVKVNQQQENDESMPLAEEEKKDKEKEEKGGSDGKECNNKGSEKQDCDNKGDEKEDGDNKDGVVSEYPLLKNEFGFGFGSVMKIPVVSKEVVEKGLESLGEDRVKNWEKRWKELEIEELNAFLAKVNTIRHYGHTLMDELKGKTPGL